MGKACSDCPSPHCCNNLDSRRRAAQTEKSDRVKGPGGKPSTRPIQAKTPTLSVADDDNSGGPIGPTVPPTEPPSRGWSEELSREVRVKMAVLLSSLLYAAALKWGTAKNGTANPAPKGKLKQVAG